VNLAAWLSIGAFLLSVYGAYDLVARRRRDKRKAFSDADRAVVTSAVELIEPYRVRVKELVEYTAELESKVRTANAHVEELQRQVRDLSTQVQEFRARFGGQDADR